MPAVRRPNYKRIIFSILRDHGRQGHRPTLHYRTIISEVSKHWMDRYHFSSQWKRNLLAALKRMAAAGILRASGYQNTQFSLVMGRRMSKPKAFAAPKRAKTPRRATQNANILSSPMDLLTELPMERPITPPPSSLSPAKALSPTMEALLPVIPLPSDLHEDFNEYHYLIGDTDVQMPPLQGHLYKGKSLAGVINLTSNTIIRDAWHEIEQLRLALEDEDIFYEDDTALHELKSALNRLSSQNSSLGKEASQLQATHDDRISDIKLLEEQIALIDDLPRDCAYLRDEISRMDTQINELVKTNEDLQLSIKAADKERELDDKRRRVEVAIAQAALTVIKGEVRHGLSEQYVLYEAECGSLRLLEQSYHQMCQEYRNNTTA